MLLGYLLEDYAYMLLQWHFNGSVHHRFTYTDIQYSNNDEKMEAQFVTFVSLS